MHLFGVEGFNKSVRVSEGGHCVKIEIIKDFGGIKQAASLELIVEDLEKDGGEWHRLNSSDLTPFVEEEVKRLFEHMQKTYAETQKELETES